MYPPYCKGLTVHSLFELNLVLKLSLPSPQGALHCVLTVLGNPIAVRVLSSIHGARGRRRRRHVSGVSPTTAPPPDSPILPTKEWKECSESDLCISGEVDNVYGISREEEDTHFPTNMINPELEIREENFFFGGGFRLGKKSSLSCTFWGIKYFWSVLHTLREHRVIGKEKIVRNPDFSYAAGKPRPQRDFPPCYAAGLFLCR